MRITNKLLLKVFKLYAMFLFNYILISRSTQYLMYSQRNSRQDTDLNATKQVNDVFTSIYIIEAEEATRGCVSYICQFIFVPERAPGCILILQLKVC